MSFIKLLALIQTVFGQKMEDQLSYMRFGTVGLLK